MKKRRKTIIAFIIFLPVLIGIFLMLGDYTSSGLIQPSLRKIGLVRIEDVIYSSEKTVKQLRKYREDKTIAGVLLRIESPGGTVSPSQEIYAEVMRFRGKKPVVVSMGNIAASGGYYIASAADTIFANPGTLTGSLGVFLRFPYYFDLLQKIGVGFQTIKAGKYKDVGSPDRAMTREEKRLLQRLVEDTHEQFIEDVARARTLSVDSVRVLADGRIYTGRQAREAGLVDTLGTFQDAVSFLKKSCSLTDKAKVVELEKEQTLWHLLFTGALWEQFTHWKRSMIMGMFFLPGPFFDHAPRNGPS